ncbi:MAG: type II secretion system protein M [Archangiaceae bacterium]|nr:type II secretion system protein M [Archangiaceae bacterium]
MKELLARLQAQFANLSAREKRLVAGAGGAVLVFVVFLISFSFSAKADAIRDRTMAKMRKLDEVQTLAATFRDSEARRMAVESQLKASNIRLLTYLEEKAQKASIELPSINPKADVPLDGDKIVESAVELSLTDVKLNRLVDFLTAVEAAPGGLVKVKTLRLEPRPGGETLTAWLTVATYKAKN